MLSLSSSVTVIFIVIARIMSETFAVIIILHLEPNDWMGQMIECNCIDKTGIVSLISAITVRLVLWGIRLTRVWCLRCCKHISIFRFDWVDKRCLYCDIDVRFNTVKCGFNFVAIKIYHKFIPLNCCYFRLNWFEQSLHLLLKHSTLNVVS